MGQTKQVFIHRFLVENTIEERLVKIQEHKKNLANNILCKNLEEIDQKSLKNMINELWNLL
jgi:SNF2 family DNA or RNA helicase